jgi:hypothetical protein
LSFENVYRNFEYQIYRQELCGMGISVQDVFEREGALEAY